MREKAYTIAYMIVTAAVFTTGVTYAKLMTQDRIRLNEEVKLERVVLRVLGLDQGGRLEALQVKETFARRIAKKKIQDLTAYVGYADDARSELIGYAFPIGGMGLWSRIEGMLALNKTLDTVIGIDFTSQAETPGLGGRITEEWFKQQFKGKTIAKRDTAGKYIRFVSPEKKLEANEVHGVTGATMTTNGLDAFLNNDINRIQTVMGAVRQ